MTQQQQPPPYPYPPYPSPYAPPQAAAYYAQPPAETLLAPARRAGILMIVLGALMFLFAACVAVIGALIPNMRTQPEIQDAIAKLEAQLGGQVSVQTLFVVMGVVLTVISVLYIVAGAFARRGGMGAAVTSLVLASLVLLYLVFNGVGSLLMPGGAGAACFSLLIAGIHVLLVVWLIQAIRASTRVKLLQMQQAQYAAQYWQYQQAQAQAQEATGGYGYGAPQQQVQQHAPSIPAPPAPPPDTPGGA
jgi:hypothetical protein